MNARTFAVPLLAAVLAVFTLVACVAGLASSAQAACAWLMWQHIHLSFRQPGPEPVSRWAMEVYESRAECEKKIEETEADTTGANPAYIRIVTRPGQATVVRQIHKENGSEIVTTYRCLPDTVDPRGPKASGR